MAASAAGLDLRRAAVWLRLSALTAKRTRGTDTSTWLRALQDQQAAAREFEYCAVADIQSWSELEPGTTLFDTVLSYENFDGAGFYDRFRNGNRGDSPSASSGSMVANNRSTIR